MSNQISYVSYLTWFTNSFQYYGLLTILPTCVMGNLVSLYIYTRPNFNKKTNTGFLYSWLCILNVIMIVYYCFVTRSNNLFKYSVSFPCGVENYIRRTFLNSITWMQVVICLDRFVAVFYPIKMNFMMKNKIVLYGIMLACLALILITNCTNLVTYPVTSATNTTACYTESDVSLATNLIATLMRIFIPFGLMLTLNLFVIYRLKQSKVRVGVSNVVLIASQQINEQSNRQMTNKEFRFTVSTLTIDFVFLFFYLPLGVAYGILTYNLFGISITSDPIESAIFNLFNNISQLFALAHTSALIFIFIIFNRYFKTELILLLRLHRIFPNLKPASTVNMTRINNN